MAQGTVQRADGDGKAGKASGRQAAQGNQQLMCRTVQIERPRRCASARFALRCWLVSGCW